MEVKIVEANGWAKVLPVDRAITRVGSASANDILLPDSQIAPFQLQILSAPELPSNCRMVNLKGELLLRRSGTESIISAFQTIDIFDSDEVILNDYRLIFSLPLVSASAQKSRSIEASLIFPEAVLRSDSTLVGGLKVKNAGDQQGVQFQVSLEGLPDDCYQIDPIPWMYPGAEEEVQVRIFHRTFSPTAGYHDLLLTVIAPADYPGEELNIRQRLHVAPVLKQELIILDSYASASPAVEQPVYQKVPLVPGYAAPASGSVAPANSHGSSNIKKTTEEKFGSSDAPPAFPAVPQKTAMSKSTPQPSITPVDSSPPKVKVVRTQGSDYWDE
jgi:hypothetical protein